MGLIDLTHIITSNTTPAPYVVSVSNIYVIEHDVCRVFDRANVPMD